MNRTYITAIASAIAFILLCINTFAGTDIKVGEDILTSIATLIFAGVMWFISHYWNQDYTHIAKKMTPIMRQMKEMAKEGDLTLLDSVVERSERDD